MLPHRVLALLSVYELAGCTLTTIHHPHPDSGAMDAGAVAVDAGARDAAFDSAVATIDAGSDAGQALDAGADAPCAAGTDRCGDACRDLSNDTLNCGACGHVCEWACVSSECLDFIELAAGPGTACGVTVAGRVLCWGANPDGQVGSGDTISAFSPVYVRGVGGLGTLVDATSVAVGDHHACAIRRDGSIVCWGANDRHQLGNGSTSPSLTPVQVRGVGGAGFLGGVSEAAAGPHYTCVRFVGGTSVACWGDGADFPTVVLDGSGVVLSPVAQIVAGGRTCARDAAMHVACWTGSVGPALRVPGIGGVGDLTDVIDIDQGFGHTCARLIDRSLVCWGSNTAGKLGDGTTIDRATPTRVLGVGGIGFLGSVTDVAATSNNTCAIFADTTAACWGLNGAGQLTDGTTDPSLTPLVVGSTLARDPLTGVQQIVGGIQFFCARLEGSGPKCWGWNLMGGLGIGRMGDADLPTPVALPMP